MNCEQLQEMFADALGNELSDADRTAFDAHLESCPTCREEYDSLAAALDAIRTLRQVPPQPSVQSGDVDWGLTSPAQTAPRFRLFAAAVRYAAVVALAFTAGFLFHASADRNRTGEAGETPSNAREITTRAALVSAHRSNPRATMMTKLMIALHSGDMN